MSADELEAWLEMKVSDRSVDGLRLKVITASLWEPDGRFVAVLTYDLAQMRGWQAEGLLP